MGIGCTQPWKTGGPTAYRRRAGLDAVNSSNEVGQAGQSDLLLIAAAADAAAATATTAATNCSVCRKRVRPPFTLCDTLQFFLGSAFLGKMPFIEFLSARRSRTTPESCCKVL